MEGICSIVMAISFMASANDVMSVSSTRTSLPLAACGPLYEQSAT